MGHCSGINIVWHHPEHRVLHSGLACHHQCLLYCLRIFNYIIVISISYFIILPEYPPLLFRRRYCLSFMMNTINTNTTNWLGFSIIRLSSSSAIFTGSILATWLGLVCLHLSLFLWNKFHHILHISFFICHWRHASTMMTQTEEPALLIHLFADISTCLTCARELFCLWWGVRARAAKRKPYKTLRRAFHHTFVLNSPSSSSNIGLVCLSLVGCYTFQVVIAGCSTFHWIFQLVFFISCYYFRFITINGFSWSVWLFIFIAFTISFRMRLSTLLVELSTIFHGPSPIITIINHWH